MATRTRPASSQLPAVTPLLLLLIALAHFTAPSAANNCPSFRPVGVDCPHAAAQPAANPACKSQVYVGRFAVQGSKSSRLPALPNGVALPPAAPAADCCRECQQRADCAYWNLFLRSGRCLLFSADVCAADRPAVFLPGEQHAFVGTRYCNSTSNANEHTPASSALSLFEDVTGEDEQESEDERQVEEGEAQEEHDNHIMSVLEGTAERLQAEEAEELRLVEAAASQQQEDQEQEGEKVQLVAEEEKQPQQQQQWLEQQLWRSARPYQSNAEAMAALELEAIDEQATAAAVESNSIPAAAAAVDTEALGEAAAVAAVPHRVEAYEMFELEHPEEVEELQAQQQQKAFQENSQVMLQIEEQGAVETAQVEAIAAATAGSAFEVFEEQPTPAEAAAGAEGAEGAKEEKEEDAARAEAIRAMEEEEVPIRLVSFSIVDSASQDAGQVEAIAEAEEAREAEEGERRDARDAAWREQEQQETPVRLTSYELLDADSLAALQAQTMTAEAEGVKETEKDARDAAWREQEQQETPVRLTSYELVDADKLAALQTQAMRQETERQAEKESDARAAALRELEEQEIPIRLNLRGHSAFHTSH